MIYELCVVSKSSLDEKSLQDVFQLIENVIDQYEGRILIKDEWGLFNFPWPTSKGERQGHYQYYVYRGNGEMNKELIRCFNINEGVIKNMIVKLGEDSEEESLVKKYRCPFSQKYHGSAMEDEENDSKKQRGRRGHFSSKKNCWFISRKIKADWKDPYTYSWLVNEFGKISPARVTGVSRKHQRFSTMAIKRARQIGILGFLSNRIAVK